MLGGRSTVEGPLGPHDALSLGAHTGDLGSLCVWGGGVLIA